MKNMIGGVYAIFLFLNMVQHHPISTSHTFPYACQTLLPMMSLVQYCTKHNVSSVNGVLYYRKMNQLW
jgi:hypothetical protein